MFVGLLLVFFIFVRCQSIVCPIYNIFNNESSTIDTCSSHCSFLHTPSTIRRCLGIFTFDHNLLNNQIFVHIRQLALVDDFEGKYVNSTYCTLDIDKTGSRLLCRCNTNNCTLHWRIAANLSEKTTSEHFSNLKSIRREHSNDGFFLLALIFGIVIVVSTMVWVFIAVKFGSSREKNNRSYLATMSSASTHSSHAEIDEFLSSNPTYQSIISRGKNSTIYCASMTNLQCMKTMVAIKVYQNKILFENEVHLLRTLNHSNMIKLINYGWYGLSPYLILEYHQLGSLESYLRTHKLSWSMCYSFLISLVEILDYLHHEEFDSILPAGRHLHKPIVVHRDLKSANILIQSTNITNLNLCLTDFGSAKSLSPILTQNDFIQIGTYRYMAPELLELAIAHTSDALCKVDMYALGLIMWEILTQCQDYPVMVDYQLPYGEYVDENEIGTNKILEKLHIVVVNERQRPTIHRTDNMDTKISNVLTIIEDCWKHEPDARINARPALTRLRRLN